MGRYSSGKDYLKIGCGGLLLAFGMLVALGVAVGRADSDYSLMADMVGLFLMGVVPMGIGGWIIRRTLLSSKNRIAEENERSLFIVAKKHGWILTPVDVAGETPMSLTESQAALDQMVRLGHAELDIEHGGLCYRFIRPDTVSRVNVLDPLSERFAKLEERERALDLVHEVEEEEGA